MLRPKLWTVTRTATLIQLYRQHPILWDREHKQYKNRYNRVHALKEIAKSLNVTVDEVERKIKNINSQYARENRLHREHITSGRGDTFRARWFGYDLLSFLKHKTKIEDELPEPGFGDEIELLSDATGTQSTSLPTLPTVPCPINDWLARSRETKKREHVRMVTTSQNQANNGVEELEDTLLLEVVKCLKEDANVTDPYLSYGMNIANELRKYDADTLARVKHAINNIIFEADTGHLKQEIVVEVEAQY